MIALAGPGEPYQRLNEPVREKLTWTFPLPSAFYLITSSVLDPVVNGWTKDPSNLKVKSLQRKTPSGFFTQTAGSNSISLDQVMIRDEITVEVECPSGLKAQGKGRKSMEEDSSWRTWDRAESP